MSLSGIILIATLVSAGMLPAQSQTRTQSPVGVKRVPPAAQGQTPPKSVPPLLQQYDFGGQLRALEGSGLPSDVKPWVSMSRYSLPARDTGRRIMAIVV